jgi:hypothetical protein
VRYDFAFALALPGAAETTLFFVAFVASPRETRFKGFVLALTGVVGKTA